MNKKILIPIIFITTIVCIVIGQYVGGYLFFNIAKIDISYLKVTSLYDYAMVYKDNKSVFRFIVLGLAVSAIIAFAPIIITVIIVVCNNRFFLFGNARFANDFELSKTGLFPTPAEEAKQKKPCILLGMMKTGRFKNKYIKYYGSQFVALAAPTRSGKGVGIMIPNLLTYLHSIVVLDIKLENFMFSGGFRQKSGHEVYLFCPDGFAFDKEALEKGEIRSHRYNPLYYIRRSDINRSGDVLTLAKLIYPETGSGETDTWLNLAAALFSSLVLYMLDMEKLDKDYPVHLPHLLELLYPETGLANWMKSEISRHKQSNFLSKKCILGFNSFISASEKTQSNILTSVVAPLQIFGTETVAAATSGNDFDFRELRRKKMSIYIGLAPVEGLLKYPLLINLFFSQLIAENTRVLPEFDNTLIYQVLLMMDELPSIGCINVIKQSVGFTAGYDVRYLFIFQNQGQLEEDKIYGKLGTETILENCDVKLIYPPKDSAMETAKKLSETLGTFTVKVKNKTFSKSGTSTSVTEQERALMKPQEIVELGYKKHKNTQIPVQELVIAGGIRPFKAEKIIYFDIPEFNQRKVYSENNVPTIPLLSFNNDNITVVKENAYIPEIKNS